MKVKFKLLGVALASLALISSGYAAEPRFTFRLPMPGTKATSETPAPSNPDTGNPSQPETPKSAKVTVSPTALDFGTVSLASSGTKVLTLSNTGTASANLVDLALSSPLSVQSSTCVASLAAGDSCAYTLAYSPIEGGVLNQSISVGDVLAPNSVSISARSLDTFQLVENTKNVALDWGVVKIGTVPSKTYTFKNSSTTKLTGVTAAIAPSGWVIGSNSCTGELAVNAECSVELIAQMSSVNAYEAVLTVSHLTKETAGSKSLTVRAQAKQGDPYWGNTQFLAGFSTLTDAKGYPIKLTGTTTITASGKYGNGLFMGSGCATLTGSSGISVADKDFTAEMQISPTMLSGVQLLLRKRATTSDHSPVMLYLSGATLYGRFTNSSGKVYTVNMGTISMGGFTHIALVKYGSVLTGYVGGQPKGSVTVTGTALGNGVDWSMGCDFSGTYDQLFHGTLDDVRLTNMARYTGAFAPPAELPNF